ncbi:hypothetical protein VUR80DRAFT_4193 [Thermomyces stellatus]
MQLAVKKLDGVHMEWAGDPARGRQGCSLLSPLVGADDADATLPIRRDTSARPSPTSHAPPPPPRSGNAASSPPESTVHYAHHSACRRAIMACSSMRKRASKCRGARKGKRKGGGGPGVGYLGVPSSLCQIHLGIGACGPPIRGIRVDLTLLRQRADLFPQC